jgi:hypothetical protein
VSTNKQSLNTSILVDPYQNEIKKDNNSMMSNSIKDCGTPSRNLFPLERKFVKVRNAKELSPLAMKNNQNQGLNHQPLVSTKASSSFRHANGSQKIKSHNTKINVFGIEELPMHCKSNSIVSTEYVLASGGQRNFMHENSVDNEDRKPLSQTNLRPKYSLDVYKKSPQCDLRALMRNFGVCRNNPVKHTKY